MVDGDALAKRFSKACIEPEGVAARMIARRVGRRLGLALLLVAIASQGAADAEHLPTAPAFLWGPGPIVGGPSGRQQQVSYQVR
jgi:hypothetical protein